VAALLFCGATLGCSASRVVEGDSATRMAVERAIHQRQYSYALSLATDAAARSPKAAWPEYERGVALHRLGRTDAAIDAYARAEARSATDPAIRPIAVYGRARAHADAGHCALATSAYEDYAKIVQAAHPEAAELALSYARNCRTFAPSDPVMTTIASAVMDRDYQRALELSNQVTVSADARPWVDYHRGAALTGLGKIDEAVTAFRHAEDGFSGLGQRGRWGQSVSVWGAARAFGNAGRCSEARPEYARYAALVQETDPRGAQLAIAFSRACTNGIDMPIPPIARRSPY
jgi:tetratricopeptide (TPR) repeat protein